MRRYSWERLVRFGFELLTAKGVPEENARYLADIAVQSEAMGIETHGLAALPYFDRQIDGELNPRAEAFVVRETAATALVDGSGGFAQLAMRLARRMAMEKARSLGVAVAGVRNCFWLAALGVHLLPAARRGFLSMLWAQTTGVRDAAPLGGMDPRFATNPVALAIPGDDQPLIADFSTTCVSSGAALKMVRGGEKAAERIFLDSRGEPTDDPRTFQEGGTIMFLGGEHFAHKGYGLSIWNEALAAMVGGKANDPEAPIRQTFTMLVLDPEAFAGREYFSQELKRFITHVKSSRLRSGFSEIRLPGERSLRRLRESAESGIALHEQMVDTLNNMARRVGIATLHTARLSSSEVPEQSPWFPPDSGDSS
jgi:LDH2 family malate/lactate/ureidoglycolate dehydrogenase